MKSSYSHFYWYAKGFYYQSNNIYWDLKKLAAKRAGIEVEKIPVDSLINILYNVIEESKLISEENNYNLLDFCKKIMAKQLEKPGWQLERIIIEVLIDIIALTTIRTIDGKNLIEMEEPNENIIPFSEFYNKQIEEIKSCE